MSDAFYPVRLRYSPKPNDRVAICDDVVMRLRTPPVLPGLENLTEIDYAPNIVALVRIGSDAMRDMTQDEQHDVMALLQSTAAAARAAYAQAHPHAGSPQ